MSASRVTAVVEDPRYRDHRGPDGHPERPERLTAVHDAIGCQRDRLTPLAARAIDTDEILRIHTRAHVDAV
ncbi:MAG: histone deacetylase family protein, partial [Myxococcota bacterium]